jgi:hypothetical protein
LPEPDSHRVFGYPSWDMLPMLPVTVAGREFHPHLDTGSPGDLTLTIAAATSLGVAPKLRKLGQARTPGGTFETFAAKVDGEIRIGDFKLVMDSIPPRNWSSPQEPFRNARSARATCAHHRAAVELLCARWQISPRDFRLGQ